MEYSYKVVVVVVHIGGAKHKHIQTLIHYSPKSHNPHSSSPLTPSPSVLDVDRNLFNFLRLVRDTNQQHTITPIRRPRLFNISSRRNTQMQFIHDRRQNLSSSTTVIILLLLCVITAGLLPTVHFFVIISASFATTTTSTPSTTTVRRVFCSNQFQSIALCIQCNSVFPNTRNVYLNCHPRLFIPVAATATTRRLTRDHAIGRRQCEHAVRVAVR